MKLSSPLCFNFFVLQWWPFIHSCAERNAFDIRIHPQNDDDWHNKQLLNLINHQHNYLSVFITHAACSCSSQTKTNSWERDATLLPSEAKQPTMDRMDGRKEMKWNERSLLIKLDCPLLTPEILFQLNIYILSRHSPDVRFNLQSIPRFISCQLLLLFFRIVPMIQICKPQHIKFLS